MQLGGSVFLITGGASGLGAATARMVVAGGGKAVLADVNEKDGQALAGEPMTVFGDGSQTRSFCYVSDLVDGIYRLLLSDVPDPVNIGNPAELSVLEFARTIKELTGTKSEITFRPLPVDDPKVRQPDITRAKSLLGWKPVVELAEGLKRTIDYFRKL